MSDTVPLRWPRDTRFRDVTANFEVVGEGVYAVPEHLADWYRHRGWEEPPEDFDGEVQDPGYAQNPHQEGPTRSDVVEDEEQRTPSEPEDEADSESEDDEDVDAEDADTEDEDDAENEGDGGDTGN